MVRDDCVIHNALFTEQLPGLLGRLRGEGVGIVAAVRFYGEGKSLAFIGGPDGYQIELKEQRLRPA